MQDAGVTSVGASGPVALWAFLGYLAVMVGIGVWASRFSSRGIGEFFVGGRGVNRFVVALSAVVSGRSAWLLLGVTGIAWTQGASALWAVVGYTVVEFVLFLTLAPRIRAFAEERDCVTLTDVFAERFDDRDGRLRVVLSIALLLFMTGYVAAQFTAGGKAIGAAFGIEASTGVLLTAAIVLGYTVLGGFLAVSVTDSIQAVFMLLGLVVVPIAATSAAGGWGAVVAELQTVDPLLVDPWSLGTGALLGLVGIGLGSPGNPHIVVRFLSIERARDLRFAGFVATFWNVVMGAGAVAIGLVGRVLVPDVAGLPAQDTEALYPFLAQQYLHPALFGVIVASIFAAIMSTADSQLLVAASTVVRDIWEKVVRRGREVPARTLVSMSRWTVAVLVLAALLLGWVAEDVVFYLVLFAWAGLGASIGPPLLLAMYWRRTTRAGVLAGVFTGAVVTIVWYFTEALKSRLYELIPAFAASVLAVVIVSLATGGREASRLRGE